MNGSGSDELTTLTNSIDTHFGTESPTDATTGTEQYQLPTGAAIREVPIFPFWAAPDPSASPGTASGACARVHKRVHAIR